MHLYARHGDLVIEKLTKIDGELRPMTNLVFAGDSSGHPHRLLGKCQMRREGRRALVRVLETTRLEHGKPDGHQTIELAAGDYEVRPLRERGDGSDRAVED